VELLGRDYGDGRSCEVAYGRFGKVRPEELAYTRVGLGFSFGALSAAELVLFYPAALVRQFHESVVASSEHLKRRTVANRQDPFSYEVRLRDLLKIDTFYSPALIAVVDYLGKTTRGLRHISLTNLAVKP